MKSGEVDLEPLRVAIRKNKLMKQWQPKKSQKSVVEKKEVARKRALEARDGYIRIMTSDKNDGSKDYQLWALRKALGLPADTKARRAGWGIKASTRRTNRGLN